MDIICVTRPSEYGKIVNLKLMQLFFEMDYENESNNNNKEFFEKLNIAKEVDIFGEKYIDRYQGKYPVVYLDFNEIEIGNSYESTIENFKVYIKKLYNNYQNISIDKLKYNKTTWINYQKGIMNELELTNSFFFLCTTLKIVLNKKIILLIDNYDSLLIKASHTNFYNKIYSLCESIFNNVFNQDTSCLYKSFITGIIDLNIFKDFNSNFNSETYNINDDKYNEYHSVTGSELKKTFIYFKFRS